MDPAVLNKGASFTLLPVLATTAPLVCKALIMRSFCSGWMRAKIVQVLTEAASA